MVQLVVQELLRVYRRLKKTKKERYLHNFMNTNVRIVIVTKHKLSSNKYNLKSLFIHFLSLGFRDKNNLSLKYTNLKLMNYPINF